MKKLVAMLASSALVVSIAGCNGFNKQDAGVLTGGAIGGAVGSLFGSGSGKIVAAVGGTLLGAFIGGAIGHSMDQVDQMKMNQALESNPNGRVSQWHNPNSGDSYAVKPTKTYYRGSQPCRDFTTRAIIGGKTQTIYGRACRMADGTWRVIQ